MIGLLRRTVTVLSTEERSTLRI